MPVVGSGSLFLRGGVEDNKSIALEVFGNITGSNISLRQLALEADMTASSDDPMSEFYNYQSLAAPETVTTSAASSIGSSTATLNGSVTSTGGVTSRGFKYMSGNQSQATVESSGTETTAGSGDGSFSSNLSGLSTNSTYTFVAWAENAAGRTYGTKTTFSTLPTYTYTVTQANSISIQNTYWQPAVGPATRTSTVAQGSTASAPFNISGRIGYMYENKPGNTSVNAQGPYTSVNFTNGDSSSPSQNWGWNVSKSGMNSNASMTLNSYFPGAQITNNGHNEPTSKQANSTPFTNGVCYCRGGYYNSPSQKTPLHNLSVNESHYLLNNPSCPNVFNNYQNLADNVGHFHPQFTTSGDPGTWTKFRSFSVNANPWVAGVHTTWGNYGTGSYRFKGIANYYSSPSDIRLKTNITYL